MNRLLTTSWIVGLFLLSTASLSAQNPEMKNALGFKILFLDYFTPNSGPNATLSDISNGFEFSYHRSLNKNVDFSVPLRFGVIDLANDIDNRSMVGMDALFRLKYWKENGLVSPYVFTGGGMVVEGGDQAYLQIPAGVGFNFNIWKRGSINIQGAYRYGATRDERNNLELGLGFIVNLGQTDPNQRDKDRDGVPDIMDDCPNEKGSKVAKGCPDRDGDGLADKDDQCPDEPGPVNGCPEDKAAEMDSDGDGVMDDKDQCPTEVGTAANNGCPPSETDTDGDGVPDAIDECPAKAGTLATRGCPDSDGDEVPDKADLCPNKAGVPALNGCPDGDDDGVADKDDNCPTTPGLAQFNGCPDSDNDGVADPNDKCPDTAGSADNFGCPKIREEEREALLLATRAIRFETGRAELVSSSYTVLDQIAAILNKYPNYKVSIAGHTDSVGNADKNMRLSEDRAKACYNYLLSKGFDPSRMSFVGFGETQPIADNGTREGRRLNRRVEFNMYLD